MSQVPLLYPKQQSPCVRRCTPSAAQLWPEGRESQNQQVRSKIYRFKHKGPDGPQWQPVGAVTFARNFKNKHMLARCLTLAQRCRHAASRL